MIAGILKEVITIKRAVTVRNDFGEEEETWQNITTTRAYVKQTSSARENENGEITYSFHKEFRVRYYVPINLYDIIEWNGGQYRVIEYDKQKDLQQITIIAELIND